MAISPELLEVERALIDVNQSLLETFADFRDRNDLSNSLLMELEKKPPEERKINLDMGNYLSSYKVILLGAAKTHSFIGYGMIFAQDADSPHQAGDPESIGVVLDPTDHSTPINFSYIWRAQEADITNLQITAFNSRVFHLTQHTRRDMLFKGPESIPGDITPTQSMRIDFIWRKGLAGWSATFNLSEEDYEDDMHYVLNHEGIEFHSGKRIKECLLPYAIDMPGAIKNILNQKPALSNTATYFRAD